MQKLFLFFFIFLLAPNTQAQKSNLFIRGGLNITKFTSINSENFSKVSSITSFNAGGLAIFHLSKKTSLHPALFFSGKGAETKGGEPPYTNNYFTATTRPYYLELPVNIVFNIPLKEKGSLFFGGGLYGALGIAGKNTIDGFSPSSGPYNGEQEIDFGNVDNPPPNFHNYAGIGYMNREDYGFTLTAGLHFKKILFSLDYGHGLKNIDIGTRVNKDENKNRVLSLSVGWQIL